MLFFFFLSLNIILLTAWIFPGLISIKLLFTAFLSFWQAKCRKMLSTCPEDLKEAVRLYETVSIDFWGNLSINPFKIQALTFDIVDIVDMVKLNFIFIAIFFQPISPILLTWQVLQQEESVESRLALSGMCSLQFFVLRLLCLISRLPANATVLICFYFHCRNLPLAGTHQESTRNCSMPLRWFFCCNFSSRLISFCSCSKLCKSQRPSLWIWTTLEQQRKSGALSLKKYVSCTLVNVFF